MSKLIANNISKNFIIEDYEIKVLKDINLDINKGETIAITGASGSGKSTLLQILALLDKQTSGSIYLNKINSGTLSSKEKGNLNCCGRIDFTVAFVPQKINEGVLISPWVVLIVPNRALDLRLCFETSKKLVNVFW